MQKSRRKSEIAASEIERAYFIINTSEVPAEIITALECLLETYKQTKRTLTSRLRRYLKLLAKVEKSGGAPADSAELCAEHFANLVDLGAQIATVEAALLLWRSRR